jgi:predicted secreted protein
MFLVREAACNRPRHGGTGFEGGVAKWQQWRRADSDRLADKNCGERLSHTCIFSIAAAGAVFLTIWFTVRFAVLPVGDRLQHETGDIAAGTDPGAPVAPRLVGKAIGTTLISGVVFAALAAFAAYSG